MGREIEGGSANIFGRRENVPKNLSKTQEQRGRKTGHIDVISYL